MRALILSALVLVSFTACITGDNFEEQADDDVIDVDLPSPTRDPQGALGDPMDVLGDLLETFFVDTPFGPPTAPDALTE